MINVINHKPRCKKSEQPIDVVNLVKNLAAKKSEQPIDVACYEAVARIKLEAVDTDALPLINTYKQELWQLAFQIPDYKQRPSLMTTIASNENSNQTCLTLMEAGWLDTAENVAQVYHTF